MSREDELQYDDLSLANANAIKAIAKQYGYDAQSRQLIEEMAELTQAVNKFWRKQLKCGTVPLLEDMKKSKEYENIVEEMADVQICLWQIIFLLNADTQDVVHEKLKRQLMRIAESKKEQE